MKDFLSDIDSILYEWRLRIPSGGADFSLTEVNVYYLREVLYEKRYPKVFIDALISDMLLVEQIPSDFKIKYTKKDGTTAEMDFSVALRQTSGHPARIEAEKLKTKDDTEETSPEDDEKSKSKQKTKDDTKEFSPEGDEKPKPKQKIKSVEQRAKEGDVAASLKVQADTKNVKKNDENTKEAKRLAESQKQINGLVKIAEELDKNRFKGVAGIGGAVPSYGEALFTSQSRVISKYGGLDGYVDSISEDDDFSEHLDKISSPGKLNSNKRQKMAKLLGRSIYDDENEERRSSITSYLAARETFVSRQLTSIKKNTKSVFYLKGKSGFGGDASAHRRWALAAFDGAATQIKRINSGKTSIDSEKPFTAMQSDVKTDAMLISTLKDELKIAEDGGNGSAVKHFKRQLKLFEKADYHDTYYVGYNSDNRLSVYHISNKLSNRMNDPQRNTTPSNILKLIKTKLNNELYEAATTVMDSVSSGISLVNDVSEESGTFAMGGSVDAAVASVVDSLNPKYMNAIKREAKATRKNSFGWWLDSEKDMKSFDELSTEDKLGYIQGFMKFESKTLKRKINYKTFTKVFTKIGETAQKSTYKGQISPAVMEYVNMKNREKTVVSDAYDSVVDAISKADEKLGFPDINGNNGPHTRVYIDTVFQALHYDTYINGYDKDVSLQMGIHAVGPGDIRKTLATLVEFDEDLETKSNRKKLAEMIESKSRINSDDKSIILEIDGSRYVIASEEWRTAGTNGKVATGFGKDVIEMLTTLSQEDRAS